MTTKNNPCFNGRYLPPFFKGDWEDMALNEAQSIWSSVVGENDSLVETLKKINKATFLKPDHIDARSIFLKPFGYDVHILDVELTVKEQRAALPILQTEKGYSFEPRGFFIDSRLDNGLDETLCDILIHNLSFLDPFMRFHVSNGEERNLWQVIIESVQELETWYDISNLDPALLELLPWEINPFESEYNTGSDGYRRNASYLGHTIFPDQVLRCVHDSIGRGGWRSHFEDPDDHDSDLSDKRLSFDLSKCRQKIAHGPIRYYLP